jgi:adenylate cyclase class 2
MAVETEAKLKVDSHDPVRQRLQELGAEAVGAHLETNIFFDTPRGELRDAGKGLRLRLARDLVTGAVKAIVTFKGPRRPGAVKSREEIETQVTDPDSMIAILRALGFEQALSFEKKRESWRLDGCQVELDEVPYLGTFVEIEGPSEASIAAVQQKLGLAGKPNIQDAYVGLLLNWLREHERGNERAITFSQ